MDAGKQFSGSTVRHGTPSGWRLHHMRGQDPCNACYSAKQEYDARNRAIPAKTAANRRNARAQGRAERRLVAAHPDEYRRYYEEAKAELLAEEEVLRIRMVVAL